MEKVKLIQGNPDRAEEISKTLEELGGTNMHDITLMHEDNYYYVDQFVIFASIHEVIAKELISEGKAEIYELPPLKPKFELKPFDKVLVSDCKEQKWKCNIFSHKEDGHYVCTSTYWNYCIPYEGNEALLGTTDNPK